MSKAETLDLLSKSSEGFVVDPYITFTVSEWHSDAPQIIQRVRENDLGPVVIARSSALSEDTLEGQPPGTFHSEADIQINSSREADTLSRAINKVIASYDRDPCLATNSELNQVIIQRQLLKPRLSGVLTSHDRFGPSPYYVIEYDDSTDRTDTVTSGKPCKSVYVLRGVVVSQPWAAIIAAARSVERILQSDQLIVEFALSQTGEIHVFQARQLRPTNIYIDCSEPKVVAMTRVAQASVRRLGGVWSDMTDWNPAEMLGEKPHPLDISLYEFLITDSNWTTARTTLGYRNVTPRKLMRTFSCKPFINVETSFLSLTPKGLTDRLAVRLVNNRLEALRRCPELHDKVELEILFTCADVVTPARTEILCSEGFSRSETTLIENSLRILTGSVLSNAPTLISEDAARRRRLLSWYSKNRWSSESDGAHLINYIRSALTLCRDLGVFSFTRLARLAFVGRDLIDRLVVAGAVSQEWVDSFWKSIDTIAAEVASSFAELNSGFLTKTRFNERFGHLRPRTYDITSSRYDQIDFGARLGGSATHDVKPTPIKRDHEVLRSISERLYSGGLPDSPDEFLNFVSMAVKERERSKFDFTIVLSDCIEAIARLGEMSGFSRLDLSYLTVDDLLNKQWSAPRSRALWARRIASRRKDWKIAEHIRHPSVVFYPEDLVLIQMEASKPNFITSAIVEGKVVALTSRVPDSTRTLTNSVVAIEAADPGYDWLFSQQIAALVTKFGGAASHMAVRCAEFGIPAAIGCGDELFRKVIGADFIRINCSAREIEFIS